MITDVLNTVQLIDVELFMQVYQHRFPLANAVMPLITNLGSGGAIWLLLSLLLFLFHKNQGKRTAALTVTALVFSYLLCQEWIKDWVARPRPFTSLEGIITLVPYETSYSFPSGHTATSFACACVLAKLCPKIGWPAVFVAAAIGFSRIYVGVHYPSDVLFGALFGIICGVIVLRAADRIKAAGITTAK